MQESIAKQNKRTTKTKLIETQNRERTRWVASQLALKVYVFSQMQVVLLIWVTKEDSSNLPLVISIIVLQSLSINLECPSIISLSFNSAKGKHSLYYE